jgi:hypothetical protein
MEPAPPTWILVETAAADHTARLSFAVMGLTTFYTDRGSGFTGSGTRGKLDSCLAVAIVGRRRADTVREASIADSTRTKPKCP